MEGVLTLHKGDCLVTITNKMVKVEQNQFGCMVIPSVAVCEVWKGNERNAYDFDAVPSNGVAEAFALFKHDWTLQMYRWKDIGSFVLEIWENATCLASLEWWNNENGVNIYTEGDPKAFIDFAVKLLPKGENEQ
jgi:hypothetical protein